jgi:hypothetical protein
VLQDEMSKFRIAFIVTVCLVLGLAIVKSQEPGGGMIPWFIAFLFLTLLNYYFGFVDRGNNPFRFLSQTGFVVFLALTLLMAYIARTEDEGLSEIEEYIAVYPHVESLHFVPRVSDRTIQHWQIESRDKVADIRKFYTNRQNLRDWTLIREQPVLVLERGNTRLTITIGEQPRSPLSMVFYHLEHK